MKFNLRKDKKEILIKSGIGISKAILILLFAGAVVVAPGGVAGTLIVLNKIFDPEKSGYDKQKLKRSIQYLKSRRLIDIQTQYGKDVYKLTKLGRRRAKKLAKSFAIKVPEKWDKKWRVVIFDIPVKKKVQADMFRKSLKDLGLANVQKSIWAHPYGCREQVYFLAGRLGINSSVRYIVAEEITGEKDLRKRFEV